jgi:hypothetical protein
MFSYHTSRHSVLLFIDSELENAASFSGLHLPGGIGCFTGFAGVFMVHIQLRRQAFRC